MAFALSTEVFMALLARDPYLCLVAGVLKGKKALSEFSSLLEVIDPPSLNMKECPDGLNPSLMVRKKGPENNKNQKAEEDMEQGTHGPQVFEITPTNTSRYLHCNCGKRHSVLSPRFRIGKIGFMSGSDVDCLLALY